METTATTELLKALDQIMQEQPDWRFGQLVANLALFARGPIKSATYDVEDQELLDAARRHLENLHKRSEAKNEVKKLTTAQAMKSAA